MRTLFLCLCWHLLFPASVSVAGQKIVVVQSSQIAPYEEARQGIYQILGGGVAGPGPKSIQPYEITLLLLDKELDPITLQKDITAQAPDLILAIGSNALAFAQKIKKVPIIYLLAPFPEAIITEPEARIKGVSMEIEPETQLAAFLELIPSIRRVGMIYNPPTSAKMALMAKDAAAKLGVTPIVLEAKNSSEVPALLQEMTGRIDAFWMIPDLTVLTPQTLELFLLFSLENRVPILTFSDKYLRLGATVSVTADAFGMGAQAGETALQVVTGTDIGSIVSAPARQCKKRINRKIAEKLGVMTPPLSDGE